jgi:hypothetical protein
VENKILLGKKTEKQTNQFVSPNQNSLLSTISFLHAVFLVHLMYSHFLLDEDDAILIALAFSPSFLDLSLFCFSSPL